MYLAVRSPRTGAPALIWPAPTPTARSAMEESSVSPQVVDRDETEDVGGPLVDSAEELSADVGCYDANSSWADRQLKAGDIK